eukprot:INCI20191.2.p1 GENE.INCI20191.2~~INCI20191.2.p1  ORF type:complete len:250 (+),score=29.54 INCI20191.2:98-847(+)
MLALHRLFLLFCAGLSLGTHETLFALAVELVDCEQLGGTLSLESSPSVLGGAFCTSYVQANSISSLEAAVQKCKADAESSVSGICFGVMFHNSLSTTSTFAENGKYRLCFVDAPTQSDAFPSYSGYAMTCSGLSTAPAPTTQSIDSTVPTTDSLQDTTSTKTPQGTSRTTSSLTPYIPPDTTSFTTEAPAPGPTTSFTTNAENSTTIKLTFSRSTKPIATRVAETETTTATAPDPKNTTATIGGYTSDS